MLANASNTHTARWANRLSERGHSVTVATCADHMPTHDVISPDVDVVRLPFTSRYSLGYFFNAPFVAALVRQEQPEIVNAHYASGYGTLARFARCARTVISVWGSDIFLFPEQGSWHRKLLLKNLRYATAIASTSMSMADQVRKLLGDYNKPITITPFGVDLRKFEVTSRTIPSTFTIGSIRGLKRIYGLHDLLAATAIVRERLESRASVVNVRLEIYGDGPELEHLRRVATSAGIDDVTRFHGRIANSEVPEALAGMNVFAMPSLTESFGVAAVEAMAARLPVVGTRTPGLREVVRDGTDGLLVDIGDVGALAEAIIYLADNPAECNRFGESGRARVEECYDFDDNVNTLVELFRNVANR